MKNCDLPVGSGVKKSTAKNKSPAITYNTEKMTWDKKGTAGYIGSPNKYAINAFFAEMCSKFKNQIEEKGLLIAVLDAISLQTSSKIIKKLPNNLFVLIYSNDNSYSSIEYN